MAASLSNQTVLHGSKAPSQIHSPRTVMLKSMPEGGGRGTVEAAALAFGGVKHISFTEKK